MAENSKIEWTHHTFNPWIGCTKVHTGCAHCYAEEMMDHRYGKAKWGPHGTRVRTSYANWRKPLAWNLAAEKAGERHRVFCASLADVFEAWDGPIINAKGERLGINSYGSIQPFNESHAQWCGSDMWANQSGWLTIDHCRRDLFSLIDATPNLDWLLLTKRPENVIKMWPRPDAPDGDPGRRNVWIGASVSDQDTADDVIPKLWKCRDLSPVLFLSAEPLVGRIRLRVRDFDWVIVGGESGHGARRCEAEWVRSLVRQCRDAAVPVFVKQLGSLIVDRNDAGFDGPWDEFSAWPEPQGVRHHINGFREDYQGADCHVVLKDSKGADMDEWPADLRVRQFPQF